MQSKTTIAASSSQEVTLFLVGETMSSRLAISVASAVKQSISATPINSNRQSSATLLLLGNVFTRFGESSEQSCARQNVDLNRFYWSKTVASRIFLRGHQDWDCRNLSSSNPFEDLTNRSYIVRIDNQGANRIVSDCKDHAKLECNIEPARENDVVDLVITDTVPWFFDENRQMENSNSENPPSRDLSAMEQQRSLFESIANSPARARQSPIRILVSHIPLESAGLHGQGAKIPSATYLNFPPWIRKTVQDGHFAGIISGHEFSHQYSEDLSNATKRSAKAWLKYPVFQIIVGNSGRPIDPWAKLSAKNPYRTSISMIPQYLSNRSGFVKMTIKNPKIRIEFFELGTRKWNTHTFTLPTTRAAHAIEASAPSMAPCLRCDPVQGAADGDQWSARKQFRNTKPGRSTNPN